MGCKLCTSYLGPFKLIGVDSTSNDTTLERVWGKVKHIGDQHEQLTVSLQEQNASNVI